MKRIKMSKSEVDHWFDIVDDKGKCLININNEALSYEFMKQTKREFDHKTKVLFNTYKRTSTGKRYSLDWDNHLYLPILKAIDD